VIQLPFVSIIIVNYNGAHFLPACLNAVSAQTYPSNRFEVIISDNGSNDGSLELLNEQYQCVRVLENGYNLGFASGNNVAIEASEGEYVILLNNDTAPNPDWLEKIVEVAYQNPRAGIVTGRLQLFYNQILLKLKSETIVPPNDGRKLGVQVFEVNSGAPQGVVQFLEGFYGREQTYNGRSFRWTNGCARTGIPVPNGSGEWQISLNLAASRPNNDPVEVQVFINDEPVADWIVSGIEPLNYQLIMPASARTLAVPLIQNAGSIIFRDGSGRDRGTYVRDFKVFYEEDKDQWGNVEEVFAGCGANMLIKRELIQDVGFFDGDLFMYYEDTDLSWRARLRGWKVLYSPSAIVRHIHCGSSEEWSQFFLYHTERNRLAMVFKNGALGKVLWSWGKYLGRVVIDSWIALRAIIRRQNNWRELARWPRLHARVMTTLLVWMPSLIQKRWKIQASRLVSYADLKDWFVK